ncbi:MAG: ATPase RavA, partial [Planctomycetota bacterium]
QLDRFMFLVKVGYPNADEELRIVQSTTSVAGAPPKPLLSADDIRTLQDMVRRVPVSDHVVKYAVEFARRTRKDGPDAPDFVKQNVEWGAGPRASQYLVLAAKAHAVLHGRTYVSGADIRAVAKPVLRHRILLSYGAQAQKRDSDWIIDQLLETIPRAEADRAVG